MLSLFPVSCTVFLFLNEKTLLLSYSSYPVLFILNLLTIIYLSSSNRVKIYPG